MKYFIALMSLFLATIASPAFAHQGNDCANSAAKFTNFKERQAYTTSCLKKVAARQNSELIGQREKEATCNQNAKNLKFDGNMKAAYLRHCYQENDFNPNEIPDPRGRGI